MKNSPVIWLGLISWHPPVKVKCPIAKYSCFKSSQSPRDLPILIRFYRTLSELGLPTNSSIKCIFFDSSDNDKKANGVLMQNDNGKLLISKPTIENIVKSVVKDFESVDDVTVDIDLDTVNNLIVNVNLVVSKDVIIKEITLNMQNKIKEAIKKTSDLEVKEVNVKIKNISNETEK